ncbi:MAG: MmgE/PrpD family protein [Chloroflexi bacterium]|nr:MmgE/PrpD family protein [Chloroflexota bacterium]
MDETRELARFITQVKYSDLPSAVIEKAKQVLLDSVGVQLAASTLPWSKSAVRYVVAQKGAAESTILNYGLRTTASFAAFANACFAHGIELDDIQPGANLHPGCIAIPAVLAMGEKQKCSGKDCILLTVLGYETMARIGFSVAPGLSLRGHNATGAVGVFGAAAIAGRALGLDHLTVTNALGIVAGNFAGINEHHRVGTNAKRTYKGMAAFDGIRAAILAQEGITGPLSALEGKKGFCQVFSDTPDLKQLTAELGTNWRILEVIHKIYAQEGFIQPMTECVRMIREAHPFQPEEVEEIRVGTNRFAQEAQGTWEPKDITGAQLSAPFSLALFLLKGGASFREYTEESLKDPTIRDLSRRVKLVIDKELEQHLLKRRGAQVTLVLKNGQTYSERVDMLRAMSNSEVDDKFRDLASVVLPGPRAEEMLRTLRTLEGVPDISLLMPKLKGLKEARSYDRAP